MERRILTDHTETLFEAQCGDGQSYRVTLVPNLLEADAVFASVCKGRRALLVTPAEVWKLHGARLERLRARLSLDMHALVLDVDEGSKSFESVLRICAACAEHHIGRTDVLLALGGGVCMDLVTVAAALVRRGIAHVRMPTTFVGQIDAGIGVKGAVNFAGHKSFLGCFRAPEATSSTRPSSPPRRWRRSSTAWPRPSRSRWSPTPHCSE